MKIRQYGVLLIALFWSSLFFFIEAGQGQSVGVQPEGTANVTSSIAQPRSDYVLGSDDEISIHARDADEISNKPMRIDGRGEINVPMLGRIRAAGFTIRDLEAEIEKKLATYVLEPEVSVYITVYRSQPVSIIGSVNKPGVLQLEGQKTLIEALSLAGGLSSDAGSILKITRRMEWGKIPLPNSTVDTSAEYSVAEVGLRSLMDARAPEENIIVMPNDVLSVPRGKIIYVVGEVNKPGGFVLAERESASVLQAMAMAQGLTSTASAKSAQIIRPVAGATRISIPVNLKDILAGKKVDVALQPEDILFIPNSFAKSAWQRSMNTAMGAIVNAAIYSGW
jgi:polysaccharide biosynthesis/export protein